MADFKVKTPAVDPTAFANVLQRKAAIEQEQQRFEQERKANRMKNLLDAVASGQQIANNMLTMSAKRKELKKMDEEAEGRKEVLTLLDQPIIPEDFQEPSLDPKVNQGALIMATQKRDADLRKAYAKANFDDFSKAEMGALFTEKAAPETNKALGLGQNATLKQATLEQQRQEGENKNLIEQLKALQDTKSKVGNDQIKNAKDLRNEYVDQSKTYADTSESIQRIRASVKDPSAAGDLALIFNYMKILDPRSVVREAEYATAENAAGVPDRVRRLHNKVIDGQKLSPDQRKDFLNRAEKLYDSQAKLHSLRKREYTRLAKEIGVSPTQVIIEIGQQRQSLEEFVTE